MNPPPLLIRRTAHALVGLLVVLAGALAALAGSAPASAAATSCGDKVLTDWFDNGRIDRLYPLHCYEDAIDAIPDDIRDYADAEEVISRALQSALRGELAPGGRDPTPGNQSDGRGGAVPSSNGPGDPTGSGGEAAPEVDTSSPSAVPIPLLVLGGMSLALLAAGAFGYLSRRRHAADGDGPHDDDFPG